MALNTFSSMKKPFEQMIREDRFLEWAEVHGHFYGTSREMLVQAKSENRDVDSGY